MDTAAEEPKKKFDPRSIDFAALKASASAIAGKYLSVLLIADKGTVIKGLAGVALIYACIFGYVYSVGEATLQKLNEDMVSVKVDVTIPQAATTPHRFMQHEQDDAGVELYPELSQYEDIGRLPIISAKDQKTSFRAYQTPFTFNSPEKRTVLAFMIKDYGLSDKNSEMALELLPPEVSFLLSPYARQPMEWIRKAREKGHEVWLDIPIQSEKYPSAGLQTIFHHQNLMEKAGLMRETLTRALGYAGVGFYLDETMKVTEGDYRKLSDELYGRGLGIFEKNPDAPKTIEANALTKGAPFMQADLEVMSMKGENSLESLEDIALSKGHAVAIIPAYPNVLKNVSLWIKGVGQVDYLVAPVSAIYDLPLARNARAKGPAPSGLRAADHEEMPVENHH